VDRIIDQFPSDRQSLVRVMLSESLKGVIAQVLCRKIGGGRVAAKEVLLSIPAVSNLIREGKTFQIPSIIQTNRKAGMVTLNDALMELVEQKVIEPKEAYLRSVEKTTLAAALKAKRLDTSFLAES
jgi:twitching motility protein PilT